VTIRRRLDADSKFGRLMAAPSGECPYYKAGRLVRFDRNEIDEWLRDRRRPLA
jgi:excisionase family DNA binding protein